MATTGPRLNPPKTTTNYDAGTISPTHILNGNDSSNPNSNSTSSHKRVYQACIPCRRRKVRCDLGSVDEPHDPPCQRCRRESKECYFSATRRKRRPTDDGRDESIDQDDFEDDYDARNRRKRIRSSSEKDDLHQPTHHYTGGHHSRADIPPPIMANGDPLNSGAQPLTPGGSQSRAQPLRRPTSAAHASFDPITSQRQDSQSSSGMTSYLPHPAVTDAIKKRTAADSAASGDDDQHLTNRLWETEVYNGHDALNLLFEAAGRSGDMDDNRPLQSLLRDSNSQSSVHNSPVLISNTPGRAVAASAIKTSAVRAQSRGDSQQSMMEKPGFGGSNQPSTADRSAPSIDPAVRAYEHEYEGSTGDMEGPGFQDALKAWFRLRFVRAGWFTAREAIEYVNYFYTFMAPLTPVIPPTFRSPSTHSTLLSEEPILTVTILTIASRYKYLPGPGGRSRSYAIHEKLWTYLRGMIERMVWGQEQFGGNSANVPIASQNGIDGRSDGEDKTSSTAPWRGLKRGSLRTLGTVESLMLLTEWHPRALHFPPGDDGDELIVKDEPFMPDFGFDAGMGATPTTMNGMDPVPRYPGAGGKGIGGKRIESWLEPAWRSDRMCWMLLGNALALAFELGVFDSATSDAAATHNVETQRPDRGSLSYRLRASRVQKLLYVYITQLAGRLEWTPMVANLASLKHMNHRFDSPESPVMISTAGHQQKRRRAPSRASSSSEPQLQLHQIDSIDETILDCWIGITDLMKSGNQHLFPSRTVTRDLIRTGKYVELLESFQPRIRRWLSTFGGLNMPDYIRYILRIEFEYVRVYINSLALQAVIERCTSTSTNTTFSSAFSTVESSNRASSVSHQAATQRDRHPSIAFAHLMAVQDQSYIAEVVDASRNLLRTVVEGLLPGDYLKHCPVRTYFRIISGAMFLLKTFALGAKEEDVAISLSLMDHTVNALRTCVVDDVHLGIRFAELLEVLTRRIRSRFVRMAGSKGDRSGSGRATPQNINATTPGVHGVAEHRGDVRQPTHAPSRGGHTTAPIERSNEHTHTHRHSNYHHQTTAKAPVSGSSTSNHREPGRENDNGWSYRHERQHNHGSRHQVAHHQHNHHHPNSSPDRHRQHHSQSHQHHPTIPSDPLFGISTTPLHPDDQGHVSVSIMPPPSYPFSAGFIPVGGAPSLDANTSSYNNGPGETDDDDDFAAYPADWLGLDLNPLLNYGSQANGNGTNSGTGIDGSTPGSGHLGSSTPGQHAPLDTGGGSGGMGGYGMGMGMGMGMYSGMGGGGSVGGFDLLEVLLNDMEGTNVAPGGRSHAHGQAQA